MVKSPDQILTNINYLVYDQTKSYTRYLFYIKKSIKINNGVNKLPKGWWMLTLYKRNFENKYLIKLLKLSKLGFLPEIFVYGENYIISKFLVKYSSLNELKTKKYYLYSGNKNLIYENIINTLEKWQMLGYAHNNLALTNILVGPEYEIVLINPEKTNIFQEDFDKLNSIFF
jgi:RIO-like serine/threonine protein kinase